MPSIASVERRAQGRLTAGRHCVTAGALHATRRAAGGHLQSGALEATRRGAESVRAIRHGCYNSAVPIGTAFHARTLALCESLNYREWAGYYAVSAYEAHHEHEYNAIRNAAALIDVSPLFKYLVTGPDADAAGRPRHHARRDEVGRRPGDLHAVVRRARQDHRRRDRDAAGASTCGGGRPPIRACGGSARTRRACDVTVEDITRAGGGARAAGADIRAVLRAVAEADIDGLKYFRDDPRHDRRRARRDLAHGLHGRSRLRDLDAVRSRAIDVWDALMARRHARSTSARPGCWRSTSRASKPACCSSTWISTAAASA